MESRQWVSVDDASRQHSRIKWTELPEDYQVENDDRKYGSLIADIKTHSDTDAIEYLGVPKSIADKLVEATEGGDYDGEFMKLIDSVIEKKREVSLQD